MMEEVDLADTPLAMRPQLQAQDSVTANEEEPPDPRIQVELERLNTSTDLINKLEVDLDEARMKFRQTLLESTQQIDTLTKKLGKCVEQARPYYEARIKAKQALTEAQKSAVRYERAVSQHAAAREMVQLAEEGLLARGCVFDSTWQEMLNHATTKVNDAEREKIESTGEHKEKSTKYHETETRVKFLQKELKRAIAKSSLNARRSLLQLSNIIRMQELQLLPYFELKAAVNQRLEEQKRHVRELEAAVASAKTNYAQALSNLETISDQIHKTRQTTQVHLGIRGVGVGAESPGPPFCPRTETIIKKSAAGCGLAAKSADDDKVQEEKATSLCPAAAPPTAAINKDEQQKIPPPLPINTCSSIASTTTGSSRVTATTTIIDRSATATTKDLPISSVSLKGGMLLLQDSSKKLDSGVMSEELHLVQPLAASAVTTTDHDGVGEALLQQHSPRAAAKNGGEECGPSGTEPPLPASEAGETQSYLSGWQFVALPSLHPSTNQSLLSIEDRDSIVSDSESLTSMEMLSEEAIANLMLEDEINEATQSICCSSSPPHFNEEFLAPPSRSSSGAPTQQIPLPGGPNTSIDDTRRGGEDSTKKEIKNVSQASSSDSGEPWEVVSDPRELVTTTMGEISGSSFIEEPVASSRDSVVKGESSKEAAPPPAAAASLGPNSSKKLEDGMMTFLSSAVSTTRRNDGDDVPVVKVRRRTPPLSSNSSDIPSSTTISVSTKTTADDAAHVTMETRSGTSVATETSSARPQSLGVRSYYPNKSSSSVSSSSTSNSISEEFSPTYAPLSDTPEMENTTTTGGNSLLQQPDTTTPGSIGQHPVQPPD